MCCAGPESTYILLTLHRVWLTAFLQAGEGPIGGRVPNCFGQRRGTACVDESNSYGGRTVGFVAAAHSVESLATRHDGEPENIDALGAGGPALPLVAAPDVLAQSVSRGEEIHVNLGGSHTSAPISRPKGEHRYLRKIAVRERHNGRSLRDLCGGNEDRATLKLADVQ